MNAGFLVQENAPTVGAMARFDDVAAAIKSSK